MRSANFCEKEPAQSSVHRLSDYDSAPSSRHRPRAGFGRGGQLRETVICAVKNEGVKRLISSGAAGFNITAGVPTPSAQCCDSPRVLCSSREQRVTRSEWVESPDLG